MKEQDILLALEELVGTLDVELRYEKCDFEGGICRVDDARLMIVNSALPRRRKIAIVARELASFELNDVFVIPAVRRVIDRERDADVVAHQVASQLKEEGKHDQ